MARATLGAFRLGPTSVTQGGGAQTIGEVSLATLTSGMTNGQMVYVDVIVEMFGSVVLGAVYAALASATVPLVFTTGPTYTLGDVSTCEINASTQTMPNYYTQLTFDMSGGNLRVRINPPASAAYSTLNCYAAMGTFGP